MRLMDEIIKKMLESAAADDEFDDDTMEKMRDLAASSKIFTEELIKEALSPAGSTSESEANENP